MLISFYGDKHVLVKAILFFNIYLNHGMVRVSFMKNIKGNYIFEEEVLCVAAVPVIIIL